jgi:hypothetical protein
MLENLVFSSRPVPAPLLIPDNNEYNLLYDFERGGNALRQTEGGINISNWMFWVESGTTIYCGRIGTGERFPLYEGENITSLEATFDRNMNPTMVFKEEDEYVFTWFDTKSNDFVYDDYKDIRSPRLAHDDKRDEAVRYSGIVFTYIKDDKVYYRTQVDRYTIEYLAFETYVKGRSITEFGMNKSLRLQWGLEQTSNIK